VNVKKNLNVKKKILKDFRQVDQLSRFEIRNKIREPATLFSTNPTVYITDNSIGVQYAVDKKVGNCTVRPVKSYVYDSVLPDKYNTALDYITKIQASQAFLQPNATYIFTGQRTVNGILSDRYISNISGDIYEYSFSDVSYT
jgi:hypothetical protein